MRGFGKVARKQQADFRDKSASIEKGRSPDDDKGLEHGHLLALGCEDENLYPSLQGESGARRFFKERGIKWHRTARSGDTKGVDGPTRNMASSQVACVNFMLPLAGIPNALEAVIGAIDDDIEGIVGIAHEGRTSPVEFEWIGLGKSLEGGTTRGANNTSVDAFVIADTGAGRRAYLMEWKYVEEYKAGEDKGAGSEGETRKNRYSEKYSDAASAFSGKVPMGELLYEPFYQLMRLRLLADRMVKDQELGITEAKVVVVVPQGNSEYRERITSPPLAERFPEHKTVSDVMRATLKDADAAFALVCPSVLVDAVERNCDSDVVRDWVAYQRERYGFYRSGPSDDISSKDSDEQSSIPDVEMAPILSDDRSSRQEDSSQRSKVSPEMREHPLVKGLEKRLGDRIRFDFGSRKPSDGCLYADTVGPKGFSLRVYSSVAKKRTVSIMAIRDGKHLILLSRKHLEYYLPAHGLEIDAYASVLSRRCEIDIDISDERLSLDWDSVSDAVCNALDELGPRLLALAGYGLKPQPETESEILSEEKTLVQPSASIQERRLRDITKWARKISEHLQPILNEQPLPDKYRPGGRGGVHFRPTTQGITMVGLLPKRPLRGGTIGDLDDFSCNLVEKFKACCIDIKRKTNKEEEYKLQAYLIGDAYQYCRMMKSLNDASKETIDPVNLQFVTDEIAFSIEEEESRCDILALRETDDGCIPVLIELKAARKKKESIEQSIKYSKAIDKHADSFAKLYSALLGRDIHFTGSCERWVVWPGKGDSCRDKEDFKYFADKGIRLVCYPQENLKDGNNFTFKLIPEPSVPANLTAIPDDGEVTLKWTASDDANIEKYQYRCRVKATGERWSDWRDIPGSGTATTGYSVPSLANGTTYTFEVRAANASGAGASASVLATPVQLLSLPSAPANLAAIPGDGEVTLRWTASDDASIEKYQYRCRVKATGERWSDWRDIPGSGTATTSCLVPSLTNGTTYTFEVRAVNASGAGASTSVLATPIQLLSFTEKKRIRKDFGKRSSILDVPYLLAIQLDSYRDFLQEGAAPDGRADEGLHAAFRSVFPIESYSGDAALEYVRYRLEKPIFDVSECRLRGKTYAASLRVTLRLVLYEKETGSGRGSKVVERGVKDVKEQEVYMGEIPLMTDTGTFIINGTERVIVAQLHRSPGVLFGHDQGKTHSSGKLLFSARVIPYRGSWLDFEFDPKDLLHVRIDRRRKLPATVLLRALGYSAEEVLALFFDFDSFDLTPDGLRFKFVPDRLRGDVAALDIRDEEGAVLVEAGRRITARHIRQMTRAGLDTLDVADDYAVGRRLGRDVVDMETGEIVANANDEVTEDLLGKLREHGVSTFETLYTNDVDRGPFMSRTLSTDSTQSQLDAQVEIYRMMRPGEPPTKEAAQALFHNLFFSAERYDISPVGRMKFNRRVGRSQEEGPGIIYDGKYLKSYLGYEEKTIRKDAGKLRAEAKGRWRIGREVLDGRTRIAGRNDSVTEDLLRRIFEAGHESVDVFQTRRDDEKLVELVQTHDGESDIVDALKTLVDIKNGIGMVDDIDHLGNRRIRSVGEMAENQFPHRAGEGRARRQGTPEPGRVGGAHAAGAHQRQAGVGGGQGVLRVEPALAVHGPEQPALRGHAQAPGLGARSGGVDARAGRVRGP